MSDKKKIHININRPLLHHNIIGQLRDTVKSQGMLSGSAIIELMDEYDRIRYLLEALVTAYEKNDEAKTREVIELLRILL